MVVYIGSMKTAHILLVEDNDGDILLTTEALQECAFTHLLSVVKNGKDAVDFVFRQGRYSDAEIPDLILLDVNLPLKNGHDVLNIIKQDDRTKSIPVIMLTTSSSAKDVNLSYRNHANCYITKPVDSDTFTAAIHQIEDFWLQLANLPIRN